MFKLSRSSKMKHLAEMLGLKKVNVASADLVCGYTCPMADKCKSFANPKTGKVTDAKSCEYRCYGTSLEAAFPAVRNLHWNNFDLVREAKTTEAMTDILLSAIRPNVKVLRVHSFGDFFNDNYFYAWVNVAEMRPEISFFAYTKVLPYIKVSRPENFSMVYSYGGKMDNLVTDEPVSYVMNTQEDADKKSIPVSCVKHPADDYNFITAGKSFALLLHGVQPKGAMAMTA